jgi:hypothetical protein
LGEESAMPAIKKDQALSKLTDAIHELKPDEIADVYNELFPENPSRPSDIKGDLPRFEKQIFEHIEKGLEVEEILDLWRVVFPKDRRVHFDEVTDEITYKDQSVLYAD